jgi:hypothetical protein
MLHSLHVDSIAYISEMQAATIFRVKVCKTAFCLLATVLKSNGSGKEE